jgi:predicted nucleic acid-binding protein
MTDLFVDTSGWLCHFDRAQPQHAAASTIIGVQLAHGRRLITTNYVITELVALLTNRRRVPRSQIVTCIDTLKTWVHVLITHIDPNLDADAWALLKTRQDKDWSLVDCASFVIMRQQGLLEALTTDHHFTQAGFVRLLKP